MGDGTRTMSAVVNKPPPAAVENENVTGVVDIDTLIRDMHKLQVLLQPLLRFQNFMFKVRRWDSPALCVVILIAVNGACILFPTSYYLLVLLCVVGAVASLGLSHIKYRLLTRLLPNPYLAGAAAGDSGAAYTHAELMDEFKQLLCHVDRILKKLNSFFINFYQFLKWDDHIFSLRCYIVISFVVITLNLFPLRWNLSLAVNIFFLHLPLKTYLEKKNEKKIMVKDPVPFNKDQEKIESPGKALIPENIPSVVPPQSETSDSCSVSQMCESAAADIDGESDLEDDTQPFSKNESSSGEYSDGEPTSAMMEENSLDPDNTDMKARAAAVAGARTSSGMMSRIIEFKKKHQQAGSGACIGCGVNFTSILKRRRTCTYCGNHFCSKCCSFKVPKSLFGVTAPTAQQEMVLVCHFCNNFLTAGDREKKSL